MGYAAWLLDDEEDNTLFSCCVLTRGQFYHDSGINRSGRRHERWNAPLQGARDEMSQNSIKTADLETLERGLGVIKRYYGPLFEANLKKRWARRHLSNRIGMQKTVDQSLSRLQRAVDESTGGRRVPIRQLHYGDGDFASGKKFERHVPVQSFKEKAMARFDGCLVDEFRTSQICHECDGQLRPVKQVYNGRPFEIRGLKWCSSDECKLCPLKDRDVVGAANIRRRAMGIAPSIMDRDSTEWNPEIPKEYHTMATPHQVPPKSVRRRLGEKGGWRAVGRRRGRG